MDSVLDSAGLDSADGELKIVVRGIPWEAREQDLLDYFQIDASQLVHFPRWPDSGRCRGVAFLTFETAEEMQEAKEKNGQQLEVDGNSRELTVRDYVERPKSEERSGRGRGRRRGRGRGRRQRKQREPRDDDEEYDRAEAFQETDESQREVYVSNVNFAATADDFREHFGECGEIEEVTIPTHYTSGKPKGFAFIRFATKEARAEALNLNESSMLDRDIGVRENKGRAPRKRTPEKRQREKTLSEKPENCTTIYVGNLPWATDEDELSSLFESCGEIKNSRIVRQSWTNKSRGFGYVEFVEAASVDAAVELKLEHEGRELRIDYASSLQD